MFLNDLNFLSILFLIILSFFFFNFTNTLQSLIVSEFLWITLYVWSVFMAYTNDDLSVLSLSLFFLVFSAIEISVGLMIILVQKNVFKSISFNTNSSKSNFNVFKYKRNFYSKKYVI